MGFKELSVLDLMEQQDENYYQYKPYSKIDWHHLSFKQKNGSLEEAGQLKIQVDFLPAKQGMLAITCIEGQGLKNMEMFGKQDPYIKFQLGNVTQRTKTVKKGGTDPYFADEEIEFWVGMNNWHEPLRLTCWDEDIGSDDLIGQKTFSLLDLFCRDKFEEGNIITSYS